MERTGGEPDFAGYDHNANELFFLIARPKVQAAAEAFVTIGKASNPEKNTDRK